MFEEGDVTIGGKIIDRDAHVEVAVDSERGVHVKSYRKLDTPWFVQPEDGRVY